MEDKKVPIPAVPKGYGMKRNSGKMQRQMTGVAHSKGEVTTDLPKGKGK